MIISFTIQTSLTVVISFVSCSRIIYESENVLSTFLQISIIIYINK